MRFISYPLQSGLIYTTDTTCIPLVGLTGIVVIPFTIEPEGVELDARCYQTTSFFSSDYEIYSVLPLLHCMLGPYIVDLILGQIFGGCIGEGCCTHRYDKCYTMLHDVHV
jgi:hypothetical protein